MASISDLTVTIHLDIDLNGEPVTHILEMPATYEGLTKNKPGMTLHLHLDAAKLAKALLPEMAKQLRLQTGIRADSVTRKMI